MNHMKTILIITVFTNIVFAQLLSIQGIARDNNGASLADGEYNFVFRLYEHETDGLTGDAVWTETQTLTVANGVFSANLGSETSMEDLDFNTEYWVSLQIGADNDELSPRTKLTLTPYAIMAQLEGATNIVPSTGNVGFGTTSPDTTLSVAGPVRAAYDSDQDNYVEIGHDGSDGMVNTVGDGNLVFGHDGSALVSIEDNGNVGIGTEDPSNKLEVDGTMKSTDVEVSDGIYFSEGSQDLKWQNTHSLQFGQVDPSSGEFNERMKINSSGNVEIDGELDLGGWESSDLNGSDGYVQMGNFLMQWGDKNSTSDDDQTFTFPVTFSECAVVLINRKTGGGTSTLNAKSWTNSGFTVNRDNGFDGTHVITFIAIGRKD